MIKKQEFDIGNTVLCDLCNKDYTTSDEKGGFLFGSKGVCPRCAPSFLLKVLEYDEFKWVRAICPPDMSFREFSLKLRNGNNKIVVYSSDNLKELYDTIKKTGDKNN